MHNKEDKDNIENLEEYQKPYECMECKMRSYKRDKFKVFKCSCSSGVYDTEIVYVCKKCLEK